MYKYKYRVYPLMIPKRMRKQKDSIKCLLNGYKYRVDREILL